MWFLVAWAIANLQKRLARLRPAIRAAIAEFKRTVRSPDEELQDEKSGEPDEKWEVLEYSLRKVGIATGEAFPALVGMARAKELGGNRYLFMCQFLHADSHHMELRIETTGEQVGRRFAVVKVEGEVLSDMIFHPCPTPIVSDTRIKEGIKVGTAHLLDNGDGVLTVSVTDEVADRGGVRQRERDVLRVSLRGYREAASMLENTARRVWEISIHGYSPPEFNHRLDAQTIDLGMRRITDHASFKAWRSEMESYFKSHQQPDQ